MRVKQKEKREKKKKREFKIAFGISNLGNGAKPDDGRRSGEK